jgi:hypothetical protein
MNTRARDLLAISGIVLAQSIQVWVVFGRFIPSTYNWFLHWGTVSETRVPYKDFFYPFPPGSLWLHGWLPNRFSDPLYAEQIISAGIWILLVLAMYANLRLWFEPGISFFAVSVSSVAYFTSPYNIIAGYFESGILFLLTAIALTIYPMRKRRSSIACNFMFVSSGFFFASAFLVKQTFLVPVTVALFCLLVLIRGYERSYRQRFGTRELLLVLSGFSVPLLSVGIYLKSQNALEQSISQVFSGESKDPQAERFIDWSIGSIVNSNALTSATGLLVFSYLLHRNRISLKLAPGKIFLLQLLVALALITAVSPMILISYGKTKSGLEVVYLIFTLSSLYFLWLQSLGRFRSLKNYKDVFLLITFISFSSLIGFKIASGPSESLAIVSWAFLMTLGFVTLFAVPLILVLKENREHNAWIEKHGQEIVVIWCAIVLSHVFVGSLSGGLSFEILFPATSFALGLIGYYLVKSSLNNLIIVFPAIAICLGSFMSFQFHNPYKWWGVNEPSIRALVGEPPSSVGYMRNTNLVSAESRDYFSSIQEMVDSNSWNGTKLIPKSSSRALAGPNNAGGLEIFGLNAYELKCPVLWWDVCPEAFLTEDVNEIISDPPEIILWNMPPGVVQSAHEIAFRNGELSSMRELNEWVITMSKGEEYELLGKLNLPDDETSQWRTWVLRLKDTAQ